MARVLVLTPELAAEIKARYEAGETVEQLALDFGVSMNTMGNRLHAAGTEMRAAHKRAGTGKGRKKESKRYLDPSATIVSSTLARRFR